MNEKRNGNREAQGEYSQVPPQSLEAEQCVLGSLLITASAPVVLPQVKPLLKISDFYREAHKVIYQIILELEARGKPVDLFFVTEGLRDKKVLDEVGGISYLTTLIESVPTASNAPHYAKEVREKSLLRQLLDARRKTNELFLNSGEPRELEEAFQKEKDLWAELGAIQLGSDSLISFKEVLNWAVEKTDWLVNGLIPRGGVIVLSGYPKVGKSTFAIALAGVVARGDESFCGLGIGGGRILYIDLEQAKGLIKTRIAKFGRGASGYLMTQRPEMSALLQIIKNHNIALAIIDSLSAFWGAELEDENDARQMEMAMRPVLEVARETNAAVLLVHHQRKTPGQVGTRTRGSSALVGKVDILIEMDRVDAENIAYRRLEVLSRYDESPPELVIALKDDRFEFVGETVKAIKSSEIEQQVLALLESEEYTAKEIQAKLGISSSGVYEILGHLKGKLLRVGKGRRGDPYRYKLSREN